LSASRVHGFPCIVLADIVGFAMGRTARLVLFGTFRVEIDGRAVPPSAWRHRRGADVVKLLALQPSHRLHRERAMTALWPDLAQDLAAANLRKALLYARRALEDEGAVRSSGGRALLAHLVRAARAPRLPQRQELRRQQTEYGSVVGVPVERSEMETEAG
jgi:hypothetical protein